MSYQDRLNNKNIRRVNMGKTIKNLKYTVQDVMTYDYKWDGVEYDYNRSGCDCDDSICRCTTIDSVWVESIDLMQITKQISNMLEQDGIGKYCVNRILTVCRMYEKDNWEIRTDSGYYGEEIDGIYIDKTDVGFWLEKLIQCETDIDKIKTVLNLEYGHLLDSVKSKTKGTIQKLFNKDIIATQKEYYVKVDAKILSHYEKFELPRAIVIKDGDYYKLIDGYHRICACKDEKCEVIVLE
jgi:hypothetical protein